MVENIQILNVLHFNALLINNSPVIYQHRIRRHSYTRMIRQCWIIGQSEVQFDAWPPVNNAEFYFSSPLPGFQL